MYKEKNNFAAFFLQYKRGFTLVELIIVISILSILWTIAFISFQWYTKEARDSSRLSVIKNLQTGLEMYAIKANKYPEPDGPISSGVFDGVELARVWVVWDTLSKLLWVSKIPTDPLAWEQYTYWISADNKKYQIALLSEAYKPKSGEVSISSHTSSPYKAIVLGNYVYPLNLWWKLYSMPSLIFTGSGWELDNESVNKFVVDGWANLPYAASPSKPLDNSQSILDVLQIVTWTWNLTLTGVDISAITMDDIKSKSVNASKVMSALWITSADTLWFSIYWNKYTPENNANSNPSQNVGWWSNNDTLKEAIMIKDINATWDSNPNFLTNINWTIFFAASDWTSGRELWKTDWTESNTVRVNPSVDSSFEYLINANWMLLFISEWTDTTKIWKSDWTEAGTILVKTITKEEGTYINELVNVNWTLFFGLSTSTNGKELWKTDWTEAGTIMVKDIQPGSWRGSPGFLANVNWTLFFQADDWVHGNELWKTDWTEAGTVKIKDINLSGDSNPSGFMNFNWATFFIANDWVHGVKLWKTNWTEAGTVMLDIYPWSTNLNIAHLTDVNWTLFFWLRNWSKWELWKSDWTEAGATKVSTKCSNTNSLISVNWTLFFTAYNSTNGVELWKSDWTDAGTIMVKDINPWSGNSNSYNLTNVNWTLFFQANNVYSGSELWKSDWTESGTIMLADINSGNGSSTPYYITNFNWTLLFVANDWVHGNELWKLSLQ